jgi:hypothetical protein
MTGAENRAIQSKQRLIGDEYQVALARPLTSQIEQERSHRGFVGYPDLQSHVI